MDNIFQPVYDDRKLETEIEKFCKSRKTALEQLREPVKESEKEKDTVKEKDEKEGEDESSSSEEGGKSYLLVSLVDKDKLGENLELSLS